MNKFTEQILTGLVVTVLFVAIIQPVSQVCVVLCVLKILSIINLGWLQILFWPFISWKFFLLFILTGGIAMGLKKT